MGGLFASRSEGRLAAVEFARTAALTRMMQCVVSTEIS
jgi:hypothetical protein